MKNRSKILLIADILASAYGIYLLTYFVGGTVNAADGTEALGGAIATALVAPHMFLFLLGAIFGWIGFLAKKAWGALVGAILYSVGTLFFIAYAMFGIPLLILGFVGYAKQKKLNAKSVAASETVADPS